MSAPSRTGLPVRGAYRIAPSRSECRFRARGMFGLPVHGTMPIRSGAVTVEGGHANVAAVLDPAGLVTGIRRRDDHLRSPQLLDVARYPSIVFEGGLADGQTSVPGRLTVHGEAAPTALTVTEIRHHHGGIDVVATASVNRHEFGVSALRAIIWPRIDVTLTVSLVPEG
jgi:polyisoprenoid-binding protein YceI